MSIPLKDVQLLRSIVNGLDKSKLTFYKPHTNRAAMALVLRFNGEDGVKVARSFSVADRGIKAEEVIQRLEHHADPDAPSSLSLLFLKKRLMQESRWSGVVAFPGGKRDKRVEKTDFQTLMHYCDYQIGLPVNSPEFIVLGRLPDFYMYSRALGHGLMTARFVILHIGELTPSVKLAHHDIKALTWAPISALTSSNVVRDKERHNLFSYFVKDEHQEFVGTHFPGAKLFFPSITMPDHFGSLWGFTLTSASTLLALHGERRMDWPLFHSNNLIAQTFFVDAMHGYLEVTKNEVASETRTQHLLSLGMIGLCALSVVVTFLSYIAIIIQAFAVAFSSEAMIERRKKQLEQHVRPVGTLVNDLATDQDQDYRDRRDAGRRAASERRLAELDRQAAADAKSGVVPAGREFVSFTKSDGVTTSDRRIHPAPPEKSEPPAAAAPKPASPEVGAITPQTPPGAVADTDSKP